MSSTMTLTKPYAPAEHIVRSQKLTVKLIDTDAGFHDLKPEWEELLHASSVNSFFLTWEWLHTWWKHMAGNRKLHIITVRHEERLIALAPLALRPGRWQLLMPYRALEFLGCGNVGSDYLSVIVREGYQESALRLLTERLAEHKLVLEFSHVDRKSVHMTELAQQLCTRGWHDQRATIESCPYIALEGHTWESYLATLGRTHRTNFKRKVKKLNQLYKLRIDEAVTEEERRAGLDILINLHLKRRREVGGSDALHTRQLLEFHEELTALALRCKWLRLHVMWLDDEPVAAMYGFEYDNMFYFYQSGFDSKYANYSVGLVMAGLVIKGEIERGIREFDFLHGEEAYKYLWASAERELVRFRFFPPDTRGTLLSQLMQMRRKTIQFVTQWRPARHGPRPAIGTRPAPAWSTTKDDEAD